MSMLFTLLICGVVALLIGLLAEGLFSVVRDACAPPARWAPLAAPRRSAARNPRH